jgi:hypothetical protein
LLVGARLPIDRPDLATAVGTAVVTVAVDLLGAIPLVGTAFQLLLTVTGLGAVLVTYYGVQEFEPALSGFEE